MKKDGLSIIISAYNTQDYIEETIESIYCQNYIKEHDNFEVLIGVDGCDKTLEKVKSFKQKYKNIRVLNMNSNMGTFITCNTLIKNSVYNKILRFDSDDIICDGMLDKIMEASQQYDIVRYYYYDYENSQKKEIKEFAYGSVLYDYKVFEEAGGYKNWKCSGDYEFYMRVKTHFTTKEIHEFLYLHRVRQDSLMYASETSMQSEYRKKLNATVREYKKDENIYIEPTFNTFKEIVF